MTLAALIRKHESGRPATAIPATAATNDGKNAGRVAKIATIAVAGIESSESEDRERPHTIAVIEDGLRPSDDPMLAPGQWYPAFRDFHHKVVSETPEFDYCWLREHRPELSRLIKAKESEIDALGPARLSEVMAIMREWRALIVRAETERREAKRVGA